MIYTPMPSRLMSLVSCERLAFSYWVTRCSRRDADGDHDAMAKAKAVAEAARTKDDKKRFGSLV